MKRPDADPILRDNRKNRPRFLVICLVCLLGGAALGYAAAALTDPDAFARAARAAGRLAGALAPFALLAAVPFLAAGFWMYRRARALFAGWDGENEDLPDRVEHRLNWALTWLTASELLSLLLFGIVTSLLPLQYTSPGSVLVAAGEFLVLLLVTVLLQSRVVDLTRRLNPEKQGSVYDIRFREKWLASCDEAERLRIGQASYAAFQAGSRASLLVWVAALVLNALLPIGPLPVLAATVPWAVSQFAYLAVCLRARPDGL